MEEATVVRLRRPGARVADDPLLEVPRSGSRQMLQQVIEPEAETRGWVIVSMQHDWRRVWPE